MNINDIAKYRNSLTVGYWIEEPGRSLSAGLQRGPFWNEHEY